MSFNNRRSHETSTTKGQKEKGLQDIAPDDSELCAVQYTCTATRRTEEERFPNTHHRTVILYSTSQSHAVTHQSSVISPQSPLVVPNACELSMRSTVFLQWLVGVDPESHRDNGIRADERSAHDPRSLRR